MLIQVHIKKPSKRSFDSELIAQAEVDDNDRVISEKKPVSRKAWLRGVMRRHMKRLAVNEFFIEVPENSEEFFVVATAPERTRIIAKRRTLNTTHAS